MHDRKTPFGFWSRALVAVVIATGWSVVARAQEAGPFRAGVDPLEATLRAQTALEADQLPRKLVVRKLAESHGIRIKLNEEALAEAGVQLDAPITASFRNFTLRAALFHVLGNNDLHFEFGVKELVVGIAPPEVPLAAPPDQLIRLWPQHDAGRLGFEILIEPTDLG